MNFTTLIKVTIDYNRRLVNGEFWDDLEIGDKVAGILGFNEQSDE